MGYRKIPNLYRPEASTAILSLDEVYALEKIHGTSAHVKYERYKDTNGITFFPGGIKAETFEELIDEKFGTPDILGCHRLAADIRHELATLGEEIIFYGEAYGGKCQKMSRIYGPLNFVVFEVKLKPIDEEPFWLTVPQAEKLAKKCGFEFVHYERGPATVEWLNSQRDKPSVQAARNGMGGDKIGEGIVIRPIQEMRDHRGNRIIAKHKRAEFRETKSVREVDPEKQRIWREARATAEEFVVPERLNHVLDKLVATKPGFELTIKNMRTVIGAMIGDVRKEEGQDIEWSNAIQKAIGSTTAKLYKEYLNASLQS